jgi:hypothetical protein
VYFDVVEVPIHLSPLGNKQLVYRLRAHKIMDLLFGVIQKSVLKLEVTANVVGRTCA